MRAGGCTVQQALTAEAASIVKQAVTLARRRGHAQVTPLHVANTMLASSTGLLRTACLQSHSHPLQCKALELCFNVALNRLPASTSSAGPILGGGPGIHHHHHHHPSLSNALVAAFKRAQAHQRRGSIENQQQPLLAVKVEVEQLIISILDDPSVSRVMKEAGFSSTQVKNNVEQALISLLDISPSSNPPTTTTKPKETNLLISNTTTTTTTTITTPITTTNYGKVIRSEDVKGVLENLILNKRRRSTVVVAECLTTAEGVVKGVMDKVDKGEDLPEELRNVQFISLPLFSFGHLSKEEVEQKLGEISCLVKRCSTMGRSSGAVLYLGDLKWAAEYYRASSSSIDQQSRSYNYCPVEHMIVELGRLVCGTVESGSTGSRLWLMGIATYQTYMRCRIGHPSLETIWGLHPLTIPVDSLGLSLNPEYSSDQLRSKRSSGDGTSWSLLLDGVENQLNCCSDCLGKFENEAQNLAYRSTSTHDHSAIISSTLPSWLQQYKEESRRLTSNEQLDVFQVKELCKKWNSFCSSAHKKNGSERTITFSSISSPSASVSSYDQHYSTSQQVQYQKWPVQRRSHHHFWITDIDEDNYEPNLRMYIPEQREPNPTNAANPNHNSASSSDTMEMEYLHRFKELNAENLKNLCNALEQKVPWQKDIIPEIASTILQCRSGMVRRKGKALKTHIETKEDTWVFFQGGDTQGKEKVARELANLVFGSHNNFVSIGLSSFSSSRSDSTDEYWRHKRTRAESSCSYFERFADGVSNNPHCVFFMDDIEQVDLCSHVGIKNAMERGWLRNSNGEEVRLFDAIVILSCESFDSRSRVSSPVRQKYSDNEEDKGMESEKESCSPSVSLDLNLSLEDMDSSSDPSMDADLELLESVDRRFIFKLPDDFSNGFSGGF